MTIDSPIITGSIQSPLNLTGNISASGAITGSGFFTSGNIVANTLIVQVVSSSVDYITGSAKFGTLASNTFQFTGSLLVSGSSTAFRVNASDLFVSSSGQVGIGTITPAYNLDVTGTGRFTGALSGTSATFSSGLIVSNTADVYPEFKTSAADADAFLGFSNTGDGNNAWSIGRRNTGEFWISNYTGNFNSGTRTQPLIIASTGAATFSSSVQATKVILSGGSDQSELTNSVNNDFKLTNSGNFRLVNNLNTVALLTVTNTGVATFSNDILIGSGDDVTRLNAWGGIATGGDGRYNILSMDSTAYGTGVGGGISFGGNYNTSTYAYTFAYIKGIKENATAGDYASALVFGTRANGGTPTERMRITSGGQVLISQTTHKYGTVQIKAAGGNYYTGLNVFDTGNLYSCGITHDGSSGVIATDYTSGGGYTPLVFVTSNTERGRFTTNGQFLTTTNLVDNNVIFSNINTNPFGAWFKFTTDPNNSTNYYMVCSAVVGGTEYPKMFIKANGGIYNYSANNVNLSDRSTKKDITALESYWNKFKAIEIVKFKYIDQSHDDYNIGVIAQQVEEVAPEFVDTEDWSRTKDGSKIMKAVYTEDMHNATIKVLQEAMVRIETLETEITELKIK